MVFTKKSVAPTDLASVPNVTKPLTKRNGKIPEDLIPDMMLMRAQGKELLYIRDWLIKNHSITVDVGTISRRCRVSTKHDRNLTKAIYARAVARGAEGFVNTLINNLDEIRSVANEMYNEHNISEWRQIKKLEADYLKLHMELFSQTKTEKDDEIQDIDEILGRIGSAPLNPDFVLEPTVLELVPDQLPEVVEQENDAVFALEPTVLEPTILAESTDKETFES